MKRIEFLSVKNQKLEEKNAEAIREIGSVQTYLSEHQKTASKEELNWQTEKEQLVEELKRANEVMEEKEDL